MSTTYAAAWDPTSNRLFAPDYNNHDFVWTFLGSPAADGSYTSAPDVLAPSYPVVLSAPVAATPAALTPASATAGTELSCADAVWSVGVTGMANYAEPGVGRTFAWTKDGAPVSGATSSTLVATDAGTYRCTVTAANGAGEGTSTSNAVTVAAAPTPTPQPTPPAPTPAPQPTPAPVNDPIVRPITSVTATVLPDGRVRTGFRLRYQETGRFSFFLQDKAGKRIPMLKRSTVGTRVLKKTFWAPVVQQGTKDAGVRINALTSGRLPAGAVLRVVLRNPDGTLVAQSVPAKP